MSYELFSASLPDQGRYCIATLLSNDAFSHDWFSDKKEAYDWAIQLSHKQPKNIYYALGGYDDSGKRTQSACLALRSHFLDIDCGENKPYPDQMAGYRALEKFLSETGLPKPTVVNSGNGLYAYWLMSEDVPTPTWRTHGTILKKLCTHHGLHIDPKIGSNAAQVLRPVGAFHKKDLKNPKLLRLVGGAMSPLPSRSLYNLMVAAASVAKIEVVKLGAPKTEGLNDEFRVDLPYEEKPSAVKIAQKCLQMAVVRDRKGDVSEPYWYAAVGLLVATQESPEIVHRWSEGHKGYSPGETDRKIEQASQYHATTCSRFAEDNPGGCDGCAFHSKVKSPWSLGLPDAVKMTVDTDDSGVELETVNDFLPNRFSRTVDKGIIFTDEDGVVTTVYKYDIAPVGLCHDKLSGQDILRLRVKQPHSGWTNIDIRCAHTEDRKVLAMSLIDAGLYVPANSDERKLFFYMIRNYMDTLMDSRRRVELPPQMGWVEHGGRQAFVLGDRLITENGVETVGVAPSIGEMVGKALSTAGTMETWSNATRVLDKPGLEPWAFALAALGFGAPLMKATGYTGALVSLVGASGRGKTAMGWWALSVWGNPKKLQMLQQDTQNATVMRMSIYNNLPIFIDEITNIKSEDLSTLAYRITQGRDKLTLTKDRREREGLEWATIGGCSTNKSLVDSLSALKSNASAEINRIFEYEFPPKVDFNGMAAYRMFQNNYGWAGELYAKYLVDHQDEHAQKLAQIQDALMKSADSTAEERYWTVTASCALYGAYIAKTLGLFHVDIARLREWVIKLIRSMRGETAMEAEAPLDWLGNYLNKYVHNTVVVTRTSMEHGEHMTYLDQTFPLRGALYIRKNNENQTLEVSQRHIQHELQASSINKADFKRELISRGALTATSHKASLGKGISGLPSVQENVWVFDMRVAAMQDLSDTPPKPHLTLVKPSGSPIIQPQEGVIYA